MAWRRAEIVSNSMDEHHSHSFLRHAKHARGPSAASSRSSCFVASSFVVSTSAAFRAW